MQFKCCKNIQTWHWKHKHVDSFFDKTNRKKINHKIPAKRNNFFPQHYFPTFFQCFYDFYFFPFRLLTDLWKIHCYFSRCLNKRQGIYLAWFFAHFTRGFCGWKNKLNSSLNAIIVVVWNAIKGNQTFFYVFVASAIAR